MAEDEKPEYVDISEKLTESNQDLQQLCADYHRAAGEERHWKKLKEEIKLGITMTLDGLGVEYATIPGYQIKAASQTKEKKQSIGTGEFYEALSFTIKETSNE